AAGRRPRPAGRAGRAPVPAAGLAGPGPFPFQGLRLDPAAAGKLPARPLAGLPALRHVPARTNLLLGIDFGNLASKPALAEALRGWLRRENPRPLAPPAAAGPP